MRTRFLISCFVIISSAAFSQPGTFYPGWATGGIFVSLGDGTFDELAVFPNGKVVALSPRGIFAEPYGQINWSALVKYNANGTDDLAFGGDGSVSYVTGPNGTEVKDLVMQPDGKFLAIKKNTNTIWRINEHNAGGDPGFANGGSFELSAPGYPFSTVEDIALDKLGRIIITGRISTGSATTPDRLVVARLNTDGTLDETFSFTGIRIVIETSGLYYRGVQCAADELNRVIVSVSGRLGSPPQNDNFITRFNENGTMDLTFGTNGRVNLLNPSGFLETDQQNNIFFTSQNGLERINSNGQGRQIIYSGEFEAAVIQPNGKIVLTGSETVNAPTHRMNLWVRRLLPNGSPDQSFGTGGKVLTNLQINLFPKDIVYTQEKIYVGGVSFADEEGEFNLGFILAYDASDISLECVSNKTVSVDAGKCYATVNGLDPIFTPAAPASYSYRLIYDGTIVEGKGSVSGKQFGKGVTTVTYSYGGLNCSFTVTVADNEVPVAKAKNITVQLNTAGTATVSATDINNGSTDNCGIASVTLSKSSFDCTNVGANTVTLTVADASGNTATTTATVTVEDKTGPDVKCKSITVYLDATGKANISPAQVDNGTTDACGIKSMSLSKTQFDCSNKGNNSVTLTAIDNNNNSSSCTATVTVVDNTAPVITSVKATPGYLWPCDRKMKKVTVSTVFTDNCPGATWRITGVAIKQGAFPNDNINPDWEILSNTTVNLRAEPPFQGVNRVYTITITCTDAAGNTATSTVDVAVDQSATTTNARSAVAYEIAATETNTNNSFDVTAYPNPAATQFTLYIRGLSSTEKTILQVVDMLGRVIETRIVGGNTTQLGKDYRPGTYFVRVMQGEKHKEIKLIKTIR